MSNENDELYDPWADNGPSGEASGAPVISWSGLKAGAMFDGIVLPARPLTHPTQGYEMRREYQDGTDDDPKDKGFLVWPPRDNEQDITRPVTERTFIKTWGKDEFDALPKSARVSRTNITFLTSYHSGEFLSDNALARMKEAEIDPNGEQLRRVILSGADLPGKVTEALGKLGVPPTPGQTWRIILDEREPNKGGRKGSTKRHTVLIKEPTPETLEVVAKYVAAEQAKVKADAADAAQDDPWATPGTAKAATGSEPPF